MYWASFVAVLLLCRPSCLFAFPFLFLELDLPRCLDGIAIFLSSRGSPWLSHNWLPIPAVVLRHRSVGAPLDLADPEGAMLLASRLDLMMLGVSLEGAGSPSGLPAASFPSRSCEEGLTKHSGTASMCAACPRPASSCSRSGRRLHQCQLPNSLRRL